MRKFFLATALVYLVILAGASLSSPLWLEGVSLEQNIEHILHPPGASYWFGTDSLGRDLFYRVLEGGFISLTVGILCSVLAVCGGFVLGAVAGWYEGWVDRVLMRFVDMLLALPSFILVAVICLAAQLLLPMEPGLLKTLTSLCLGIVSTHWMSPARVTRGLVLEIKRKPYIEAAVALGARPARLVWTHMLPNMLSTLLVLMALQVPMNILYESSISFIGLGVQPPYTSWGILVKEGWKTLSTFPHLILFPSGALFLTVWSVHVVTDTFNRRRER